MKKCLIRNIIIYLCHITAGCWKLKHPCRAKWWGKMAECASIPSDSEDEEHAMPDLSHFSIRKQTSYRLVLWKKPDYCRFLYKQTRNFCVKLQEAWIALGMIKFHFILLLYTVESHYKSSVLTVLCSYDSQNDWVMKISTCEKYWNLQY